MGVGVQSYLVKLESDYAKWYLAGSEMHFSAD